MGGGLGGERELVVRVVVVLRELRGVEFGGLCGRGRVTGGEVAAVEDCV